MLDSKHTSKKRKFQVKNIEFHEPQKVLISLLSEYWTEVSHEGFKRFFPQHGFEKSLCDHSIFYIWISTKKEAFDFLKWNSYINVC